jgi:hypothetical protein
VYIVLYTLRGWPATAVLQPNDFVHKLQSAPT